MKRQRATVKLVKGVSTLHGAEMDAPKGNGGSANPVFIIPFRASFIFWLAPL